MKAVVRLVYKSHFKWSLCGLGSVKSLGVFMFTCLCCVVYPLQGGHSLDGQNYGEIW